MHYSFPVHAIAVVTAFILIEAVLFTVCLCRTRLASGMYHDRVAVAVSVWNRRFAVHGFAAWQVAVIATYAGLFAQA